MPSTPPKSPRKSANSQGTVIVGIDFGTTFSGVAFTWSNQVDKIEIITSWDADTSDNTDECKAPTAITYGPGNKVTWGYSIEPESEQLKWVKLLLLNDEDIPEEVRTSDKIKKALEYLQKHKKTAEEAVTTFLRHLWEHSIDCITRSISKGMVNYAQFHIVITLPAIWPSYAREKMRLAAEQAGMLDKRMGVETQLTFISEPEAAAIATLADMEGRFDVKDGDTFVVADCGGGTVDLISYKLIQAEPMIVKECVKGSGGLCGAVFLDEAFTNVLKSKFGKKWVKMDESNRRDMVRTQWETGIKRNFKMSSKKSYNIRIPMECLLVKERRAIGASASLPTITITPEDVREAFNPVVEKINRLINGQINAVKEKEGVSPKYVILVGGFGRCNYLYDRVNEIFGAEVEVLQAKGDKPWTAICRGAVIHAATQSGIGKLSVQVQTRVARASYGICLSEPWDTRRHDPEDKYLCEIDQKYFARNQMAWLLKEIDEIAAQKPMSLSVERTFDCNGPMKTPDDVEIFETNIFPPPTRWDPEVIKELCSIKWETVIDPHTLPKCKNRIGGAYSELRYRFEMNCSGESVGFAIYRGGKKEGSKSVKVDYNTR
ncbi:hypothetical protein NEUTE1DRAFT_39823 [Neurospora tetrasperma FGSC 2508]|uniref:Actin-like ATPase domain-containing protein n=1 Tax=Neurospora tetrasperma (strain FGSC 2508 / ATCC MYA-4615 / P0657) TaxID=510951 RepID=F8MG77_NEUT8|nr:uncharacterized protein NEUTE1DRAFT_39823 [Neurospora tetrasperma FGSC 2508]EGO59403.1 hypothetical protein NEUTE1DRAFT_39823 [Neurospora tetrasperma FGSC 2508]EGZ73528.1 actin-like ATPase domain-containing protein [Neurospora tetrasperma FGSC 2509]